MKNGLQALLDTNKLYQENYDLNKTLIDMEYIPEYVRDAIKEAYSTALNEEKKIPRFGLFEFFQKHKLMDMTIKVKFHYL